VKEIGREREKIIKKTICNVNANRHKRLFIITPERKKLFCLFYWIGKIV
jgi:hypothetical protein